MIFKTEKEAFSYAESTGLHMVMTPVKNGWKVEPLKTETPEWVKTHQAIWASQVK